MYMSHNYFLNKNKNMQNANATTNKQVIKPPASILPGNDNIVFVTQPPLQPIYPNVAPGQCLLGSTLIPIITTDKQISATEKNLQIIEEVRKEKEKQEGESKDVNQIYLRNKEIIKCQLHPKQLADKCRKCKDIKKQIELLIVKESIKESDLKNCENELKQEEINSQKINLNVHEFSKNQETIKDNKEQFNFERNNPSFCNYDYNPYINYNYPPYFNNLMADNMNHNQTYEQPMIDTTEDKVFKVHGDPLTCNLNPLIFNNILSSKYFKETIAFMGFNEILEEILHHVTYAEPWAVGVSGVPSTLYCCIYKLMLLKLTERQVKYLINNTESSFIRCAGFLYIRYLADPKELWDLLSPYLGDEEMFTPRVDQKYKMKMGEYIENLLKENDYYGTRLPKIPIQIERNIKAKLIEIHSKRSKIMHTKDVDAIRETDSRRPDIKKKESELIESEFNENKHHKNKSNRRHSSSESDYEKKSRKNKTKSRRSRSRSRSRSYNKNEKTVMENEKESALAKGKDYAIKPTSFKSSLSYKLPGNNKKRSRSPSPLKQNVQIIKRQSDNIKTKTDENKDKSTKNEYSKEFLERQELLKKHYCETTINKTQLSQDRNKDDLGPDVMKLG